MSYAVLAQPGPEPAYVRRGHEAEIQQRVLRDRIERFHATLVERLKRDEPNLVVTLEPPTPAAVGYQFLPRIVPDTSSAQPEKPQVVSYSWLWSETLIAREMTTLVELETDLRKASDASDSYAAYAAVVKGYKALIAQRRLIDADFGYNWLWQANIARDRVAFERATKIIDTIVERSAEGGSGSSFVPPTGGVREVYPPAFVRIEETVPGRTTVTVPVFTDVIDAAFVEAFRKAVEENWSLRSGAHDYSLHVEITNIAPQQLYCASTEHGKAASTPCAPPARGSKLNLAAHVARFPAGGAVLTTAAEALHVTAGRAITLGPHDVTPRMLAHEFGHTIGFDDTYLRGFRDLDADGYKILELVPDVTDIMGNPRAGTVSARHFEQLVGGRKTQALMDAGLDALYTRRDPALAVGRFREVLRRNPDHYGATLQLATALDDSGHPGDATAVWKKVVEMAEAAGDTETAARARDRLSPK